MSIIVEGVLSEDARKCTRNVRDAVVVLRIDGGSYDPFEVAHVVGASPDDHLVAERLAAAARKGAYCTVTAMKITHRRDHDIPAMVLREPVRICVGKTDLL